MTNHDPQPFDALSAATIDRWLAWQPRLWQLAATSDAVDELFDASLAELADLLDATYVAVAGPHRGGWRVLAAYGPRRVLPAQLLSETLDREDLVSAGAWLAVPLEARIDAGELLVVESAAGAITAATERLSAAAAAALGSALNLVRRRAAQQRRIERLSAVLTIASQWNRAQEMEPLLKEMAEAAIRLLDCDRASIFLWDRHNHVLVGRPALGVEGDELRVPDNVGIVGQVVRTGQNRRVDLEEGQEAIYRNVDEKLGYHTKTLLCVPMVGRNGELFGVFECINKHRGNFTDDDEAALSELATHAAVTLENTRERQSLITSRRQITEIAAEQVQLIGESPAIEALRSTIRRVAATDLAILVLGENGTGKEVVSQAVHYLSSRRDQPFIAVNCAALTETLLESELFGHEKGAFTDAHEARPGKFELANGGTLFLDEIGDLSPGGQAKLLRVLEEKVVVRVGGSRSIHTDVRVIAATNQDLAEMVRQKRFRQDLYFRLNVVTIDLPPLRQRDNDVLLLAEHFLADFCRRARRKMPALSAAARKRLLNHDWPGNVRELRNLMERLAYLCPGDRVEASDLAFILAPSSQATALPNEDLPLAEATAAFQTAFIQHAIDRASGNMSEAAKQLGLHRSNLYRKMRQLGMNTG